MSLLLLMLLVVVDVDAYADFMLSLLAVTAVVYDTVAVVVYVARYHSVLLAVVAAAVLCVTVTVAVARCCSMSMLTRLNAAFGCWLC